MLRRSDLYDLLCLAITNIEEGNIEDSLERLIRLQNNWETIIGVKGESG